nr:VOC family protein [uncultured Methanoregula sp.]
MANIAYFDIPADNVDRAKHFYHNLLGWKIEPAKGASMDQEKMAAMEYQEIITGEAKEGTMNMGGLYKRQMGEGIKNYVMVEDLDKVLLKVVKLGGKIVMPKEDIKGVGQVAIILDSEGNGIGLWKPGMP